MRGRIRTVKPEIHLDEGLWDLECETGWPVFRVFVGLMNFADREGRFEWRPRALKAAILPFWDGDFGRVLDALTARGFLVKYACGTREYGLVRTFKKHQHINNREDKSTLPAPPEPEPDASGTREGRVGHAGKAEGNGRERKGTHSSRAHASAHMREGDPGPTDLDNPSGVHHLDDYRHRDAVELRFKLLHMTRFGTDPIMSGASAANFPERVVATAKHQGIEPVQLLEQAFKRWCDQGCPGADDATAYTAFSARFERLARREQHPDMPHVTAEQRMYK
jgi:hypothetical protein